MSRRDCALLDTADPLAALRDHFVIPDGVIYLDGNSLGPLTHAVAERVRHTLSEEWGHGLIRSWNDAGWVGLPHRIGDRIAALIGASPGTVMVGDSTSVNLFKVCEAARRLRPDRRFVVSDNSNFPTDLYILEGICRDAGLVLEVVEPDQVVAAICDDTALVALTEVDYRSGRRHDMRSVTEATSAAGAISVWDLAHSAGAFPVELDSCGVDFAVGCGYKYLNGGPGAPAFLYVAARHRSSWSNPITGWFGHARPFSFELAFDPAEDMARAMVGTPPVLSMVALDTALDVFDGTDMNSLREKSLELSDLFIELATRKLGDFGLLTPTSHVDRGSQVALTHDAAYPMMQALIARGVIGDFRAPNVLRFGLAPMFIRFVDVFDAVAALEDVVTTEEWREPRFAARHAVT